MQAHNPPTWSGSGPMTNTQLWATMRADNVPETIIDVCRRFVTDSRTFPNDLYRRRDHYVSS